MTMWKVSKEAPKIQSSEKIRDKDFLNCPQCKVAFKWTGSARGQRKSSRLDLNSGKFLVALQHYLARDDLCQYKEEVCSR